MAQVVGKYELGKVLGSGDFDCRIRLCTQIYTGAKYAVKIYSKAVLSEARWIWDQLAEAVQVMRTLPKHDKIVEMVECFETSTGLYILMPFVEGSSIYKMFNEKKEEQLKEHSNANALSAHAGGGGGPYGGGGALAANPTQLVHPHAIHRPSIAAGIEISMMGMSAATSMSGASSLNAPPTASGNPPFTHHPQHSADLHRHSIASIGTHHTGSDTASSVNGVRPHSSGAPRADGTNPLGGGGGEGLISLENKRAIFDQVLQGLQHMHSNDVAHLGIAPDHILLTKTQGGRFHAKITFLVMCKRVEQGKLLSRMCGTTHTVAPEILRQEPFDPFLADMWSCGCVLYYMLMDGRYPFDGANTSKHILEHNVRAIDPAIPEAARDLVTKLMNPDPSKRLSLAEAMKHRWISDGKKHQRRVCVWDPKREGGSYRINLSAVQGLPRRERGAVILQAFWREYTKRQAVLTRMNKKSEAAQQQQQQAAQDDGTGRMLSDMPIVTSGTFDDVHHYSMGGGRLQTYRIPTEVYTKNKCNVCGRLPQPKVVPSKPIYEGPKFRYEKGKFTALASDEEEQEVAVQGANYV